MAPFFLECSPTGSIFAQFLQSVRVLLQILYLDSKEYIHVKQLLSSVLEASTVVEIMEVFQPPQDVVFSQIHPNTYYVHVTQNPLSF
jgi:hypothetical protein